ncbi:radical SAM family heme chaperone HemW [Palleronia sp. KMU-117]|uniref:radical SAM family heme chaperone HemW n=1 Tax=Palleronia sp. KMU-117 TaxID=3434108 RepID=UPI003D722A8C
MAPDHWQRAGFGLYLHWPFCQAKCPYCDFNSHVAERIDESRWNGAFLSEIQRIGAETQGRVLSTVFFGGGTPSLMSPDLVASILEAVRAMWPMSNDPEITLEANPTSVEAGRFRGYAEAGVNRVSMGVQSLRDDDLRRLGRLHSVAEARAAFDIARANFDRISFDLIYARQDQTLDDWKDELSEALSMAADHLSLYQLTIEDGTAFGDRFRRGRLRGLPDEDLAADMYDLTQELCEAAGLPAYETSNHARPGAESRHNLIYWRSGDYTGIGPGAHGRLTLDGRRLATEALRAPGAWLQAVDQQGSGERPREVVPPEEQLEEFALMGLRLSEGIDAAPLRADPIINNNINDLISDGLLEDRTGRLTATARGRPLLNAVLRAIFA